MFCFEIILFLFLLAFPVIMYGFESWTIRKTEHRRIDAFELWHWRRLLRVPWTARRSNQSILREISPGYSLEGLMLRLKLQYFGHLMRRADSFKRPWCWEGLRAGGEGDNRGWDGWMTSLTQWTWIWMDSGSWWWTGRPGVLRFMGSQRVGHDWVTELNYSSLQFFCKEKDRKITKIIQIFLTQLLLLFVSCTRACTLSRFSHVWLCDFPVCVCVCISCSVVLGSLCPCGL